MGPLARAPSKVDSRRHILPCCPTEPLLPHFLPEPGFAAQVTGCFLSYLSSLTLRPDQSQETGAPSSPHSPICISFACIPSPASGPLPHRPLGKEKCDVLVTQLCLTLCDLKDCSPPSSSVHEILQARILEWVAMPFSRGSS